MISPGLPAHTEAEGLKTVSWSESSMMFHCVPEVTGFSAAQREGLNMEPNALAPDNDRLLCCSRIPTLDSQTTSFPLVTDAGGGWARGYFLHAFILLSTALAQLRIHSHAPCSCWGLCCSSQPSGYSFSCNIISSWAKVRKS